MTNFDVAQEALEKSLNSEGSAMTEHEKWMESLQAKINQLKAAWQGFAQAFMSSDFLKGALDALIKLLEVLTKLVDTLGVIPALAISFFAFKGLTGAFKIFSTMKTVGGISKLSDMLTILSLTFPTASKGASKFAGALKGLKGGASGAGGALTGLFSALGKHPVIAAAVIAVTALTAAFTYQKKKAEELAQQVDETVSSYQEQHKALMDVKEDFDATNENSMVSRYGELSKGVDNLGRNISLTADEYSEYQSIVNSIAETIPSLVSGYDEQGNAILNCKGNVEELTAAYEKLIHVQNQDILSNVGNIQDDFENTVEDSEKRGMMRQKTTSEDIEALKYIYENNLRTEEEISDYLTEKFGADGVWELAGITKALDDAGVEDVSWWTSTGNDVVSAIASTMDGNNEKIKAIVDDYYTQFDEAVTEQKAIGEALLSEAFDIGSDISGVDYSNIGEDLQDVAKQVVGSFDWDFLTQLEEDGKSVEDFVNDMLADFNSIGDGDAAKIEAAFDLQTQFNGGEISYGEYIKNLGDIETLIEGLNLDPLVEEQLKVSLDVDEDGIIKEYDALLNRLTDNENYDFNITEEQAKGFLDGLSSEQLPVAIDVITELSNNDVNETIDEVQKAIDRELTMQGLTLDLGVEVETAKLESVSTAITESFSGSGLSTESLSAVEGMFKSLDSYDPSKLFERTANGIRMNSSELSRLNNEYKNVNLGKANEELDTLGDIYNQTREELYKLTYGTDEYNKKAAELSGIEDRINATEQLIAQYEGLTSAYQEWQRAESAGNQRDMYENVITGFETVKDELSRGWADDGTIEFLELITGRTDLAGKSGKELKNVYDGLGESIKYLNKEGKVLEDTGYSVRDFFTVDDEGNSTSKGVYNFLDAIGKLEEEAFGGLDVIQRDDNGNVIGFDFDIVGGNEVIAEALGVSEELVDIMIRAADDAGFVISMDGTYQQLDVLKEKAQESAEVLNGILEKNGKEGFDFNFNSTDVEDITNQLKSAKDILSGFRNEDGTINMEMEGAEEALTVASTLQSMLDDLSRPAYMDIQTSQVEENLQEPLKKLQELQTLTETEHQLKLTGADTSELTKSKEEIYEYFEGLDPDIKAEVGLVDDKGNPLSGQALRDKIDSGEVEIPATVDVQLEMDDKLGVLVDKALLDAGIIDDEEFEKRVDVYLNGDVDNSDLKEETANAVNDIAKPKGVVSGNGNSSGGSDDKVEKNVDVEVKADEVDTSDVESKTKESVNEVVKPKGAVSTGKDGQLEYRIGVDVDADVETDNAEKEVDKATDKVVEEAESDENLTIDKEAGINISDIVTDDESLSKCVESIEILNNLPDDIDKTVKVDIEGNVFENTERAIDNLGVFVESAQGIDGIPDEVDKSIKVDIEGNVFENTERAIDNLGVFVDSATGIDAIPDKAKKTITANIEGNVFENTERAIDNLGVFVDSAQGIDGIPDRVNKTINANIEGSVFNRKERAIDNLGVFVESAQGIDGIPDKIDKTINANIEGSVFNRKERAIDNLGVFVESAQGITDIPDIVNKKITADIDGTVFTNTERAIDNLGVFVESAQGIVDIPDSVNKSITANIEGSVFNRKERAIDNLGVFVESAQGIVNIPDNVNKTINANIEGSVFTNTERAIDNLGVFVESAQGIVNIPDNVNKTINANIEGSVFNRKERAIDNLGVFVESAQGITGLDDEISKKITANIEGSVFTNTERAIDNLGVFVESAQGISGLDDEINKSIKADVSGTVLTNTEKAIDNLAVFADSAQGISGLDDEINKSITANIEGNVFTNTERAIDNLGVFVESAQGISGLDDEINKSITANIDGSVFNRKERAIDNLAVFVDSAQGISGLDNEINKSITANIEGSVFTNTERAIDNLGVFVESAQGISGLDDEINKSITANVSGTVLTNTEDAINNLAVFATSATTIQSLEGNKDISITANASGNVIEGADASSKLTSLTEFKSIASGLTNQAVTVSVTANVDSENIDKAIDILTKASESGVFKDYSASLSVTAKISSVEDSVVQTYIATPKNANGKVTWNNETTLVDAFKNTVHEAAGLVKWDDDTTNLKTSFTAKGTVTWTSGNNVQVKVVQLAKGSAYDGGSAFVDGSSGNAFAQGNWGVKGNGVALGGELGTELVVRNGRWFTVGDQGAEFFQYKKNDIVFNATQTASLFKYGGIKGADPRGKIFATGSAFAEGNAFDSGSGGGFWETGNGGSGGGNKNSSTGKTYGKSSSNSSSSDSANDFEETLDWIEIAIERIERAIDQLDTKANSVYRSWTERNKNLADQIGKVREEIDLQQKAYDEYKAAADAVGLDETYAKKVREGTIDIETITDENLKEKIDDYQQW